MNITFLLTSRMEKSHLNFVKQSNATYSSSKKWYLDRLLCAIISKVSRLVWQVNNLSSKQAKITPVQRLIYNNLALKFTQNWHLPTVSDLLCTKMTFNQYSSFKFQSLFIIKKRNSLLCKYFLIVGNQRAKNCVLRPI